MSEILFFGVEPILIDKVLFYREDRRDGGKYVFESNALAQALDACKNPIDLPALNQALREIFWRCNQGRRPWSLPAEQSFLELASHGANLLAFLHAERGVESETYGFIDPLGMARTLGSEAHRLGGFENRNGADSRWERTISIFNALIRIYVSVFDCWTMDYPDLAVVPSIDSMSFLLETDDDREFTILLTALARTRRPEVARVLLGYADDDEESVATLARQLLRAYF